MKLPSKEILQDLSKTSWYYCYFIGLYFINLGPPTGPPLWGPYGSQGEPVCALSHSSGPPLARLRSRLRRGWLASALGSALGSASVSARLLAWISDGFRLDLG